MGGELRPLRRLAWFDVLLAIGFSAGVMLVTLRVGDDAVGGLPHQIGAALCIVAVGVALAVRRIWPVGVLAAILAVLGIYAALDLPGGPVYVGLLIAIYTVATVTPRLTALTLAAATTLVLFLVIFVAQGLEGWQGWIHLIFLSWAAAAVFLGDATRNRRRYLSSLEERAHQAEETREEEARRRVAEERVRIARDLHDVIAHGLATIAVQSGAGAHVIDRDPAKAREALLAIRETSKQALGELRLTLDTLHQDGEGAPRQPAPGLADMESLVEGASRAGLRIRTDVLGERYDLPPAIDTTAYRILQESLTNIVRHAGPADATVSVRYASGFVEMEIVDNGRAASGSGDGGGHGIAGMKERAMSVGGSLEAGPRDGGGFRVWTQLPRGLPG